MKKESGMPKFSKTSPAVVAIFEELVKGINCEKRSMFGYPVYFINGNMFTGTFGEKIIFKISLKEKEDYLKKYDFLILFEPLKGRIMKEYLAIEDVLKVKKELLKKLISDSEKYTRSLPVKKSIKK